MADHLDLESERNKKLSSVKSILPSNVRFVNRTKRRVDVIWINYEGIRVKYRTLDPNSILDVNTFVTHPWIFRDAVTRDKMVVRNREIFEPPDASSREYPTITMSRPARKVVFITLPVFTLRERCFQVIRQCVHSPEAICELDIPHILKEEFLRFIKEE